MSLRLGQTLLLLSAFAGLDMGLPAAADEPVKGGPLSVNELSMEVAALQALFQFDFSKSQLETLRKFAKETAQEVGARQAAKASDDFRTTLATLRDALVKPDDEERIGRLLEHLDSLRDSENPEVDDALEITDEARSRAPEVLKLLSARQVATHLASYGDQMPDPTERLLDALGKVRGLNEKEWKKVREEVSEDVGRLVAGLDVEKAGQIGDKVVQLFIQVRALKDDEFKTQRPELEKMARQIVGNIGAFDVLRHVVEQALAELLSNPRLAAAVDARLKK
jgi:hypothetical protein